MRRDTMTGNETTGIGRRSLLKGMGLGVAGAAAVAVSDGGTAGAAARAAETPQEQVKQRYRETDHVKRYYALNRL